MRTTFLVLALLAATAASAAAAPITSSAITSPGPVFVDPLLDLSPAVTVTGTSSGGLENIKIICDYGDGWLDLKANVALNGDGSFSTSVPYSGTVGFACVWKAVDNDWNLGSGSRAAFTGPLIGVGGYDEDMGSGANAAKVVRLAQYGGGAGGYTGVRSFTTSCFMTSAAPRDAATGLYPPANLLNCLIPTTDTTSRAFTVDGVDSYSVEDSAGDAGEITGVQRSFDATDGDFTISWSESTSPCAPDCTPGPFRLSTTATTTRGGRVIQVVQGWRNTDSAPHTLKLRYLLDLTASLTPGWRFPGQGAYATHVATETGTFPAAPATVRMASGVATTDGATNQTRAALTTRPKPDSFTFADDDTGEMVWERSVPAGGELRLVLSYAHGFLQADIEEYVAATEAALVPTVAYTGSDALTTTTVTGTTADAAGGLPSVTVNGVAAAVASDGTWSVTLPLTAGANALSAVATIDGVASTAATRTVTYTPPGGGGGGGGGGTPPPTGGDGGTTPPPGGGTPATKPVLGKPKAAGSVVAVDVTCAAAGRARGALTAGKRKLGAGSRRVAAAQRARLTVPLSKAGRKHVKRRGRVKARLRISCVPATGATTTKTVAVTLRAKQKS